MSARRVAPDDHKASIEHFLSLLNAELGTVVHVGAHAGEEVDSYRQHGAERIVLVEANPDACEALRDTFTRDDDVDVVHAAVTDRNGTERLFLHTDSRGGTESASLLPMKRLGQIVPTLRTPRSAEVPAATLDSLLEERGIDPSAVGLLVLDIQGAELQALRGAPRALRHVGAVLVEVALIELYEGAAMEQDVARLLADAGFRESDALYYELYEGDRRFPAWGDCLFVRAG